MSDVGGHWDPQTGSLGEEENGGAGAKVGMGVNRGACGGGESGVLIAYGSARRGRGDPEAGAGSLPCAAPCAASAPHRGPAPVAMGTAAAARLARALPASVSAAPGAGRVG